MVGRKDIIAILWTSRLLMKKRSAMEKKNPPPSFKIHFELNKSKENKILPFIT